MQNHQADSPLYVRPDVRSADLHLLIKSMVIHDTECPFWDQASLNNTNQTFTSLNRNVLPHYLKRSEVISNAWAFRCTGNWYFWFKHDLGQMGYAPQVRPNWGSNSWPPDHDSTLNFHVTETPALTTRPTVTSLFERSAVTFCLSQSIFSCVMKWNMFKPNYSHCFLCSIGDDDTYSSWRAFFTVWEREPRWSLRGLVCCMS